MAGEERNFAEEKVVQALEILKSENRVSGFRRAEKNGPLDSRGIDFLIWLETNLILPLQVKSSPRKLSYHYQKYPHIIAMVVREKDDAAAVRKMILRLLKNIRADLKKYDLFISRKTALASF